MNIKKKNLLLKSLGVEFQAFEKESTVIPILAVYTHELANCYECGKFSFCLPILTCERQQPDVDEFPFPII